MNKQFNKLTEHEIKRFVDDYVSIILENIAQLDTFLVDNNVDKIGRFLVIQRISNAVWINCNPNSVDIVLNNIKPQLKTDPEILESL